MGLEHHEELESLRRPRAVRRTLPTGAAVISVNLAMGGPNRHICGRGEEAKTFNLEPRLSLTRTRPPET